MAEKHLPLSVGRTGSDSFPFRSGEKALAELEILDRFPDLFQIHAQFKPSRQSQDPSAMGMSQVETEVASLTHLAAKPRLASWGLDDPEGTGMLFAIPTQYVAKPAVSNNKVSTVVFKS
jgi:hypothetical protein